MNSEAESFVRALAQLRPAKAELDPAKVFYEAGFAAGEAASRRSGVAAFPLAATALIALGLSAAGGFYAGHQRGERIGFLAAADAARAPAAPAPPNPAPAASLPPAAPETDKAPSVPASSPAVPVPSAPRQSSPAPQPRPASSTPRVAVIDTPAWQWIVKQLDPHGALLGKAHPAHSRLPRRISPEQWEELVNFRQPVRPLSQASSPRQGTAHSYPESPDSPLTISPSKEWLRAITTY